MVLGVGGVEGFLRFGVFLPRSEEKHEMCLPFFICFAGLQKHPHLARAGFSTVKLALLFVLLPLPLGNRFVQHATQVC